MLDLNFKSKKHFIIWFIGVQIMVQILRIFVF